ncbi:LytTR family DNA-binding domain-containing protein [Paracrocinitomix mangrovi]|uniref:LytR/AlgR family response regulator transcription factor n=1 Tax=Paracrocinitomix mangrovi TaxID=2862509 RepID=UPI001C8DB280|nr:LytTR family DNA-binding domain-containing protein [Paracrocinitomix mangrovi]UKN00492.1 LytTR family DNA-binding domain-containing protein [Paracrocinitomix mangrovi]
MIKAVIIDDIPEAITVLKSDLENYCVNIEVVGSAEGVVSGAKLIKEVQPDLVFLDIQMQDGSGFDLLEILPEKNFKLIFTTASDEYAVKAFKFSAVDYLLKPIDPDELMDAVSKIENQNQAADRIDLLKENFNQPKRIALNTLEKIHIVNVNEILRCESNINYTMFYFTDDTKLLVTKTLKEFDKLLGDHGFIRVHQSHLINTAFIKEFIKSDGYIIMKDGTKVPVSTRKKQVLMDMIANF